MTVDRSRTLLCLAAAAAVFAGCQGNLGTGTGLPQPPGSQVSPGAGGLQSRQRQIDGAVYLTPDANEVPFPSIGGFGLTLYMVAPSPTPSPLASGARRPSGTSAPATAPPTPTPSPSPSPRASGKPGSTPMPGPKIDTKTTIFPEAVPVAPTPKPTGNVQAFNQRKAIVRGYLLSQTELTLYSLAGVRFRVPADEQTSSRGFVIAISESRKRKKEVPVAFSSETSVSDGAILASGSDPIKLKKNTGYSFVLYGDELPPTAAPTGYPSPSNRFATPNPLASPGTSVPPGTIGPTPAPSQSPYT
ncbi:MAG: hypothetical protein GIW95_10885, partial [Candidatus Eremiobacteraeota bacterium]|nr:hypothetical protein [Candidatus Eremiobacteraeota bacterium]